MSKKNSEKNKIVLIFGRKYSGKTTIIKKMINTAKKEKNILIIDKINKFKTEPTAVFNSGMDVYNHIKNTERFIVSINTTDLIEIETAITAAYMAGNISIFIDEADDIFGNFASDEIRDVILRGRNQGIDLILSTLRPHKLGVDIRNQADIIYSFNVVNRQAIKTIIDEFGRPELLEYIPKLKTSSHEYLKLDIENNTVEIYVHPKEVDKRQKEFKTA